VFFQRGEIFHQVHEFLRSHALLQASGHDREFRLLTGNDVTLLVLRDDAPTFLRIISSAVSLRDQAIGLVPVLQSQIERFVAEGNSSAGVEDGLEDRVLPSLLPTSEARAKFGALSIHHVAMGAAGTRPRENLRAVGGIALHLDQL
jgi:hypothetical protein